MTAPHVSDLGLLADFRDAIAKVADSVDRHDFYVAFVGALSYDCEQTPEGRAAWAAALKAVSGR